MHYVVDEAIARIYKVIAAKQPNNPILFGRKLYSQCDEDGIIGHILDTIAEHQPLSKSFIEFGASNGLENTTYALLLKDFAGCWIEGSSEHTRYIEEQVGLSLPRLLVINEYVTCTNTLALTDQCIKFLGTENIDFLSMDIDGNDFHIMRVVMEQLNPKLVCVEYNAKFPPPIRMVMDYNPAHSWVGDDYYGASLQAWVDLFTNHTLVCCNITGANAFFVRNDLCSGFTAYPIADLYQPAMYALAEKYSGHKPSLAWLRQNQKTPVYDAANLTYVLLRGMREFPFWVHDKPDQFISPMIREAHVWEAFETELLRALLQPDDIFLDIGANIGYYTAVAAMCIDNRGHIHAFEPEPDNYAVLEANTECMRNLTGHKIIIYNLAVGEETMSQKLFLASDNLGDHRMFATSIARRQIDIEVTSLDDLFHAQLLRPTVVKSDTQGSEASIIAGAKYLFMDGWKPVFLFEFFPEGLRGAKKDAFSLWKFFYDHQYMTFEIRPDSNKLRPLSERYVQMRLNESGMREGGQFMDIVAIPNNSSRILQIDKYIERGSVII